MMNEKMKTFLEEISKNKEVLEKAKVGSKEDLIALAKELGFTLTEADFEAPEGELSEKELAGVSGGGECWCVVGGGGTEDSNGHVCACVAVGIGEDNGPAGNECERCFCPAIGYGHDE